MRKISFWIWLVLTVLLAYALDNRMQKIPAMGYLLSPTHGFWRQIEGEKPEIPAAVFQQLKAPVKVIWDSTLVPHIFAEHDEDLYFVQGYITASMRLWQMDFQTRAAAGRISEVVGEAALDFDKAMRRKGMTLGAQRSLEASMADPTTKIAFSRYADGVNEYIKTLNNRTLPVEYKLLGMQPEAWEPYKSALLLEYMANMLNTFNNDIPNTNFLEKYGLENWQLLFGGPDDKLDPIVNAPGSWQFPVDSNAIMPTDIVKAPEALIDAVQPNPDNGSNNWAIAPSKAAGGNAILANDPHLSLNLPALWFVTHLNTPSQNAMGVSLPGTPGIIIGFNTQVAWGFTNAQRDLVDWYRVTFADATKSAIVVDGTTIELETVIEEIAVRDGETVFDTLRISPFGIIANHNDLIAKDGEGWAYRWIGQEPSEVAIALMQLNRAQNKDDYMAATNHFHSPAQNIIYADVAGNIGIRVQGRYLARKPNEGLFLRDGSTMANAWQNYIPEGENVIQFNPERGFVSSANQFPVDSTYPYFVAASQWESHRNRRINSVLRADSAVTVADVMALHNDNFNLEASENLRYWLQLLEFGQLDAEGQKAFEALMNWNYMADLELVAPVYYDAWRDALLHLAWDEMRHAEKVMTAPSPYRTFALLKQLPDLIWWDIDSTTAVENATALVQIAFGEAMKKVGAWRENHEDKTLNWSNFKATRITHLTRQMALSVEHVPIGGNHGIVNATSQTHGPSWRQIVELAPKGLKAWGIYPGGQSGNPGSAYYSNWILPWAKGNYLQLNIFATEKNIVKPIATTDFIPQN